MDHLDDDATKQIVTPFGQSTFVQSGIRVAPFRSLRERFLKAADLSEVDLNPEACLGAYGLKGTLLKMKERY